MTLNKDLKEVKKWAMQVAEERAYQAEVTACTRLWDLFKNREEASGTRTEWASGRISVRTVL